MIPVYKVVCHGLNSSQSTLKAILAILYKPLHVLSFPIPKGNAKHNGNHLPKEIADEKHVSAAEDIRAKQFDF